MSAANLRFSARPFTCPPLDKGDDTRNAEICQELRDESRLSVPSSVRLKVSESERPMLAAHLVACVGNPVHFFASAVKQADQTTSIRERDIGW
jgi:hypothetical protein